MAIDKSKRGTALSINLPLGMAQAVYAKVRDGSFDSAGAVVREALRRMLELDDDDVAPSRASKERG
jgi:Arc/MetJ-type ribon-helix-helix transcriptional regulator